MIWLIIPNKNKNLLFEVTLQIKAMLNHTIKPSIKLLISFTRLELLFNFSDHWSLITCHNSMIMTILCHHIYYDPRSFSGPHRFIFTQLWFFFLFLGFSSFLFSDLDDFDLEILDLRLLRGDHDLLLLHLCFHIAFKGCHLGLELLEFF